MIADHRFDVVTRQLAQRFRRHERVAGVPRRRLDQRGALDPQSIPGYQCFARFVVEADVPGRVPGRENDRDTATIGQQLAVGEGPVHLDAVAGRAPRSDGRKLSGGRGFHRCGPCHDE